jgi:1,4-alpha-glucan branching enzyme
MPAYPTDKFDDIMLAVYRGDIDKYDWCDFTIPDHSNLIIYELLFRDFTGTEGKAEANGTVRQAIAKIPYLKALGVNAIELMPIMEFNGNNSWGYNTNFYMAPDKAYGSPEDYKEFIDLCHKNGMAVILDIVFNQSDGLHPWYQMYPIASNPFYNQNAPHSYSVLNDWNQDNALVEQQWTDAIKLKRH